MVVEEDLNPDRKKCLVVKKPCTWVRLGHVWAGVYMNGVGPSAAHPLHATISSPKLHLYGKS